jgi:hypothetical protein
MEKEYVLECECGAKYLYQGKKDYLNKFLDSQIWMCNLGRHDELGKKGDYLKIVEVRDELSKKTEIEPKKKNEYTVPELQKEFGTALVHIGFGVFRDPEGNVWDYRLSEKGERLYFKR